MSSNDWVEIDLEFKHMTRDAYMFHDGDDSIWIPKSVVLNDLGWDDLNQNITVEIAEWWAIEAGMV